MKDESANMFFVSTLMAVVLNSCLFVPCDIFFGPLSSWLIFIPGLIFWIWFPPLFWVLKSLFKLVFDNKYVEKLLEKIALIIIKLPLLFRRWVEFWIGKLED